MIPDCPPEEILLIEAKWSKKDLQRLAAANMLDTRGDKELLVSKLRYVGLLDEEGELVSEREMEPVSSPSILFYAKVDGRNPIKQFCCRHSDACAPVELLQEGRFLDRISWLRQHYKENHPGEWGRGRMMETKINPQTHLYLSKPAAFIESLERMYRTDRDAFARRVKTVKQAIKERERGKVNLMPEFSLAELRRILNSAEALYD